MALPFGNWLEQATAEFLANGKSRQVFLKRTLDTKDLREANIRAKPVLIEFDRILAQADALTVQRPMRTALEKREIAKSPATSSPINWPLMVKIGVRVGQSSSFRA